MFTIAKTFTFDAAHFLPAVPDGHKCKRLHGHTYSVELVLQSNRLDEFGFVADFNDLTRFKQYIDENFDHRLLNDLLPNPTAELIARHLYYEAIAIWPQVLQVKVSETPKTWAIYEPEL